jgi:hypothetical protein
MKLTKTIIVLAKSIKHNNYCIAGKDITSSEWVRIVSDEEGSAISNEQSKCTNNEWEAKGNRPYSSKVLQKIAIEFTKHAPLSYQPENYVISDSLWHHEYGIGEQEIKNYLDNPDFLWNLEERVEYSLIENNTISIKQSLYLVKVDDLQLYKNEDDKRRASFLYNNQNYDLPVTDPNFDNIINTSPNLQGILCVSLGENFNGYCYKIVATIF